MWIQRIETREQLLELLADVVRLFAKAEEQRRFFPNDQQLGHMIRDLYGVMLDAIQALIDMLLRTHKGSCMMLYQDILSSIFDHYNRAASCQKTTSKS